MAQYNGGEVFYLKLTQVCIIVNDLCMNSETQKRTRLDELVRKLVAVVGSRKSIRYLSVRVKHISDFRILYNSYLSERNVSFFTKDQYVIQSEHLPEIRNTANVDEINDLLGRLSRYISYDIANVELEHTLHHLFFDVLKHSMNMPMYYYCMSVLGSALAQVDTEIDETAIANWLDSDRLRHSSIEDEYKEISRIVQAVREKRGNTKQTRGALLINAINYIHVNYQKDLTVAKIAEELYISETYLSRIFKRSLNVSAFQYLINYRIERAKFLLEKTDYTVYMIAERCGFHDAHHFAKIFKKQTGLTPTEFRKQFTGF